MCVCGTSGNVHPYGKCKSNDVCLYMRNVASNMQPCSGIMAVEQIIRIVGQWSKLNVEVVIKQVNQIFGQTTYSANFAHQAEI